MADLQKGVVIGGARKRNADYSLCVGNRLLDCIKERRISTNRQQGKGVAYI